MRTLFYDGDFKCHTVNDGTRTAFETEFFDGKCDEYVEGHLFVPSGKNWTGPEGKVYPGEMIVAWKDYDRLDAAQRQYEKALIADMTAALNALGVNADG